MKFELEDTALGIMGVDGLLTIKLGNGSTVTIEELPLAGFERFYKLWSMACKLGGKDDFLNAWTFNQPFRETITRCLDVVGISEPGLLSLSQLEALLLAHDGGQGIIFKLHNTFPKLMKEAPETKVWTLSLKTALKLATSTLHAYLPILNWKAKLLAKVGLYLLSCVSWLSNRMPEQPQMRPKLKVQLKENGQPTLEILN